MLGIDACRIFFDGTFSEPRLDHPECVAVAPDGAVWCGGEIGQIYRIDPDGRSIEQVASTGGFCLGLAFGPEGALYVCDAARRAVIRYEPDTGDLREFTSGPPGRPFTMPNYPAFDAGGRLYVSDSGPADRAGPGVHRFEPSGEGECWHEGPFMVANGLALEPGGGALYVVETFASRITRIAIEPDGRPGEREVFATARRAAGRAGLRARRRALRRVLRAERDPPDRRRRGGRVGGARRTPRTPSATPPTSRSAGTPSSPRTSGAGT